MYAHRPRPAPRLGLSGMTSDLRNRLLLLLVLPLCVLALVGVWMADIFAYFAGRTFGGRFSKGKLTTQPAGTTSGCCACYRRWPTRWWRPPFMNMARPCCCWLRP